MVYSQCPVRSSSCCYGVQAGVGGVSRTPNLLLACTQERQDRQHAAMILVGGAERQLLEDAGDVLLDGARGDHHAVRDGMFGAALGHPLAHIYTLSLEHALPT